MHGEQAVSEQGLVKQMLERLPADGVLMGDINFGVFSVAWDAQASHHAVLFRVQEARARRMAGGFLPPANSEQRVEWRPSRDERRAHPELPADAVVRGRLIVAHVEGKDGKTIRLCLFTTLEEPRELLVEVYRRRWDIELDIRSLKQTLRLHSLTSKTPAMVEKELLLSVAGYNLVRSVQREAARLANLEPKRLSFSRVQAVVMTAVPRLASINRCGAMGGRIPAGVGLGRARQTTQSVAATLLSASRLGPRRHLPQAPAPPVGIGYRSKGPPS